MAQNNPPQAQVDVQNALLAHDRVRRSTDLPVFYGNPAKDIIISPRQLVKRFENAARIATWNTDEKKCNEFYMILRDDAITWWETLEDYNVDVKNWNDVKAQFIKRFEPKATARTSCANLVELTQRPGESTNQFYFRLFRIYRRLCETRPDTMADVRLVPANPAAATAAELRSIKQEGITDMEMFLKHQLFLAGTREPMRTELMKAGKATLAEAIDFATELENIYKKDSRSISAITEEADVDVVEGLDLNELNDDELETINAIRKRFGKKPFFKRNGNHNRNNHHGGNHGNSNGSGLKCRYCQKMGHMQKVCKSRLRDKAPLVDANGKPFTRRVNAVEEQDEDVAISTVSGPGLNWK